MLKKIRISDIIVSERKRRINLQKVKEIYESIKKIGLINFITVTDKNEMVAGNHRLEALKLLNYDEIEVNMIDVQEIDKELVEIDENLIRSELTKLEHANHLLRRKEIYEIKFPETKQGISQALATNRKRKAKNVSAEYALTEGNEIPVKSFVKDTAEKTGISERTIHEEIQIAKNISDESKEAIKDSSISNKKTKLLELSKTPEKEQLSKALSMISKDFKESNYFKNVVKRQKKYLDSDDKNRIENLLLMLENEIADNNDNAISTYKSITYLLKKQTASSEILSKFNPYVLAIAIENFSLYKVEFIIEVGYNPFLLPKLIDEKKSILIDELKDDLKAYKRQKYDSKIENIKMLLNLLKENKYEEVCQHLFEVKIYLDSSKF